MKKTTLLLSGLFVFSISAMENGKDQQNSTQPSEMPSIVEQVVNAEMKIDLIKNLQWKNPYIKSQATTNNYHYPKANPNASVITNLKELAEQGAYLGFHDYVRQSVAQKCTLVEVETLSVAQKLWHWLRDVPTEDQVAQSLKSLNDIDMGYQTFMKLSKKMIADDIAQQENKSLLTKNREMKLKCIVDFSELSLKYFQKNSSANPQFKNELIGVLFALGKEFETEEIKSLDIEGINKDKFAANVQKIALTLSHMQ